MKSLAEHPIMASEGVPHKNISVYTARVQIPLFLRRAVDLRKKDRARVASWKPGKPGLRRNPPLGHPREARIPPSDQDIIRSERAGLSAGTGPDRQ